MLHQPGWVTRRVVREDLSGVVGSYEVTRQTIQLDIEQLVGVNFTGFPRLTPFQTEIIALTLWKTIKRDGISQSGHATMPVFMGSKPEHR